MNLLETLKGIPGFVYQIRTDYYFLGKWICKPCTEMEIADTLAMYNICLDAGELQNAGIYLQKLRAYSDFALDVPYNPAKIQNDMQTLIESLSLEEKLSLEKQITRFLSQVES